MRLLIRVLVTFILCFGDFVSAECAWILWSKTEISDPQGGPAKEFWNINQVNKTMEECQEFLKDSVRNSVNDEYKKALFDLEPEKVAHNVNVNSNTGLIVMLVKNRVPVHGIEKNSVKTIPDLVVSGP